MPCGPFLSSVVTRPLQPSQSGREDWPCGLFTTSPTCHDSSAFWNLCINPLALLLLAPASPIL